MEVRTVGDMGELPSTLPVFLLPDVPLTLETLWIVLPYSAGVAAVGLLESLMTAQIVDDLTDTPSDRHRECVGQGVDNIATGFLGRIDRKRVVWGRSVSVRVELGGRR